MDPISIRVDETFVIDDPGMYGIERIMAMKLAFPLNQPIIYGALVRDHAGGDTYFVTDEDLARYRKPAESPDLPG